MSLKTWLVRGKDRQLGAIGLFEEFSHRVEAATEAEAMDKARAERYAAGREHVHITYAILAPEQSND